MNDDGGKRKRTDFETELHKKDDYYQKLLMNLLKANFKPVSNDSSSFNGLTNFILALIVLIIVLHLC